MRDQQELLSSRRTRGLVRVQGIVRKELLQVLRQPRLLVVLVLGPFVILVLFGLGFDREETALRTEFVGPEDSIYEDAVSTYEETLEAFVTPVGYSSDVLGAQQRVQSGEIDLVVQFPPDASENVLEGEQAVINVFHDKIDPIQQDSVNITARLAVLELNAEILERMLGEASGGSLRPVDEGVAEVDQRVQAINQALDADDLETAQAEATELQAALADVESVSRSSVGLAQQLGGEVTDEQRDQIDAMTETTSRMEESAGRLQELDDDELREARIEGQQLAADRDQLQEQSEGAVTLDPEVLTRPFRSDSENLQREPVRVADYFSPNTIALLLAHLALTIAAMGLVRGEETGLFEVFRVGPTSTRSVLGGTYLSHVLLGSAVAAALVAAVVFGMGVPMRGDPLWLVPGLLLLITASVGLGVVVGVLARSDTQAVQMSMLVLLAGLFFGGFFLDLELFRYPVKLLSWALPVTYGIRLMQDVMLRGDAPALFDLLGLVGTTLAYGTAGMLLLRRRLRIRAEEPA